MGVWGSGFFENDDAMEWVAELEETGFDAIQAALMVTDVDEIEMTDATVALAASVVVLAMAGSTFKNLPEEVEAWLEEHAERPETSLLERTLEAAQMVHESSELRSSWEESDDFKSWDRLVRRLVTKLTAKVA